MKPRQMTLSLVLTAAVGLLTASFLVATKDVPAPKIANDDRAVAHVLNRIGFGPRAGDIERVKKMGVAAYIDQQLHPEAIPDTVMTVRLERFETLDLSTKEIAEKYYIPALMERRARQRQPGQPGDEQKPMPSGSDAPVSAPAGAAAGFSRTTPEQARESSQAMRNERTVLFELTQQKILRAVYSERQLNEVMVDFWFNHFNVFAGKGPDRIFLTSYERDTIRPHALGKFRDLLGAVAESPAMLFYLDNWMSSDPSANVGATGPRPPNFGFGRPGRRGRGGFGRTPRGQDPAMRRAPQQQRRKLGLNENYARELMELHTLGVDGGYTQKDVVEVARCFTGWTIDRPRAVGRREAGDAGGFTYEPRMHDDGEKVVLGQKIKAGGGRNDGAQVLDMLARHPSTARFIATKLARRFVSDNPPDSLIDRAATRFAGTNGDIREVVRTIVTSPEFFAPEAYRAKVKSPLEFVVSAVRVTGADVRNSLPLAQSLRQLGMPLYFAQPPTGYADRAEAWVNTGALLNRMNFAVALVENRLRGVAVDLGTLAGGDVASTPDRMVRTILTNDASPATRGTLAKGEKMTDVVALAIGAPEFQRR